MAKEQRQQLLTACQTSAPLRSTVRYVAGTGMRLREAQSL